MTPREALLAIREVLLLDSGRDSDIELTVKIDSLIQEGLAHPVRNCDTKTVDEGKAAFLKYCDEIGSCKKCPYNGSAVCEIEWAYALAPGGEK